MAEGESAAEKPRACHVLVEVPSVEVGRRFLEGIQKRGMRGRLVVAPTGHALPTVGPAREELEALVAQTKEELRIAIESDAPYGARSGLRTTLARQVAQREALRGGDRELTDDEVARAPAFGRWVARVFDAIESLDEPAPALEAIRAELERGRR